ncbi:hypothetical protein [Nostoc sp.]|uniref:hypothetical protein n=1 Tax=Nostoc sp. TaxID=1180 RepID=UPI002FFB1091
MRCIYQRHLGKVVRIFNCGEFDLRVSKRKGLEYYGISIWYNPYHEHLSGIPCGSIDVTTSKQVDNIVACFGMDMDVEGLPKAFSCDIIERTNSIIDDAHGHAITWVYG